MKLLFEVKKVDRAFYEKRLRGWLPEKNTGYMRLDKSWPHPYIAFRSGNSI